MIFRLEGVREAPKGRKDATDARFLPDFKAEVDARLKGLGCLSLIFELRFDTVRKRLL